MQLYGGQRSAGWTVFRCVGRRWWLDGTRKVTSGVRVDADPEGLDSAYEPAYVDFDLGICHRRPSGVQFVNSM